MNWGKEKELKFSYRGNTFEGLRNFSKKENETYIELRTKSTDISVKNRNWDYEAFYKIAPPLDIFLMNETMQVIPTTSGLYEYLHRPITRDPGTTFRVSIPRVEIK